jgi:hypothetical protein
MDVPVLDWHRGAVAAGLSALAVVLDPWRGFDDVEYATQEWVAWFNTQRLLAPLGYLPPAEYEEQLHRTQTAQPVSGVLN